MIYRIFTALILVAVTTSAIADITISEQIDSDVWQAVSQSVVARDIKAMGATYHADAVVINSEKTAPIASTLIRWGKGMQTELENGSSATVAFRFSERMDNPSSAFEKGIFNYISTDAAGVETGIYVNFEALLVKKDGRWLILMENQLSDTDKTEWDALH